MAIAPVDAAQKWDYQYGLTEPAMDVGMVDFFEHEEGWTRYVVAARRGRSTSHLLPDRAIFLFFMYQAAVVKMTCDITHHPVSPDMWSKTFA